MRKIIFLDIDGVLNSEKFWEQNHNCYYENKLDKEAIERLGKIVDHTGAHIVLSSSWRQLKCLREAVDKQLGEFNMATIGRTPMLYKERGYEIQEWLDGNCDVESFVILDDDDDMVHLIDHLVHTDCECGLSDEDVEKAINILNKVKE